MQPDFITHKLGQILKKYQLRPIRYHDLRHSCATIMLYLGYTLKDIQTWLGHSNYNFTADTYIHSGMGAHEQMAQTFSERLGALLPHNLLTGAGIINPAETGVRLIQPVEVLEKR